MTIQRIRVFCAAAALAGTTILRGQVDPGPRTGPAAAGGFYPELNANEQAFFTQALTRFQEVDSVSGAIAGEAGVGLGPTFNGNSCAMCHAQPAIGGSSPGLKSPQKSVPNPQVALARIHGASNTVPSFITVDGPVREARFISTDPGNSSATRDGGVHGLFTIAGRTDASGCTLAQPDFASEVSKSNVIFRIPTPVFGLGLVENTPDATLQANLAANQSQKSSLGISGKLNASGNDGTVTRFGWKAQNKSLLIFAGEAYNVEQGVSNEAFPNERSAVAGCVYNPTPEDSTNIIINGNSITGSASKMSSDVVNFAAFMRMSAAPTPAVSNASEQNGQALFTTVGCALCHSPALVTGSSPFTGMSNVTYHPFSDFAVHRMGANLADGIVQGSAGPEDFRTAPLWGLGQRLFFLHDGRTSDLLEAIQAHATPANGCSGRPSAPTPTSTSNASVDCTSEANQVIQQFNALSNNQKQDLLNFLRSL